MIVIETDRIYAIYCRTNRRVKWQYAEYGGRYRTPEEAIEAAKMHYGDRAFEYMIENPFSDEFEVLTTGFVNWKGKS